MKKQRTPANLLRAAKVGTASQLSYERSEGREREAMIARLKSAKTAAATASTKKRARERKSTTGESAGTIGGSRRLDPRKFFGR